MLITATYIIILLLAIIACLFSLLIGTGAISFIVVKVPFAPAPQKYVAKIIDEFNLKPGQNFYDLGCGDGRFLIAAARRGANAIGFEVSPWAFCRAKFNIWLNHSSAKIIFKNFYNQDLSSADAVFAFLLDTVMAKVEAKLRKDLKPGAIIGSYGFNLPTWKEDKLVYMNQERKSGRLYLYKK